MFPAEVISEDVDCDSDVTMLFPRVGVGLSETRASHPAMLIGVQLQIEVTASALLCAVNFGLRRPLSDPLLEILHGEEEK